MKYKIAFCHVPFADHFESPFDVADEIYEYSTRLLEKIGIDLLVCGHIHKAYFIKPHTAECRNAAFPTAVCSIPASKRDDGSEYYTGGLIEIKDGKRRVKIVPSGEELDF